MVNVVTGLTKYALILFLAIYTLLGFRMAGKSEEEKEAALWQQNILFFGMHFLGNLVLYLNTKGESLITFYVVQLGLFSLFLILHHLIYPKADKTLNHNLLLLLSVGLLMLARLSSEKAERQLEVAILAMDHPESRKMKRSVLDLRSGGVLFACGCTGAWFVELWCKTCHHHSWNYISAVRICKNTVCILYGGNAERRP